MDTGWRGAEDTWRGTCEACTKKSEVTLVAFPGGLHAGMPSGTWGSSDHASCSLDPERSALTMCIQQAALFRVPHITRVSEVLLTMWTCRSLGGDCKINIRFLKREVLKSNGVSPTS